MVQSSARLPDQTHFIGVLAPEPLAGTLERCRHWMGEQFGCRSGFTTPFHVTLIPPFAMNDNESLLMIENSLDRVTESLTPFIARAEGFGAFAERTLFARVIPDDRWSRMRDALFACLSAACPAFPKKDARPFVPHLTVANRDIPPGTMPRALQYFQMIALAEDFPVDHVVLFERRRGAWETARAWRLETGE